MYPEIRIDAHCIGIKPVSWKVGFGSRAERVVWQGLGPMAGDFLSETTPSRLTYEELNNDWGGVSYFVFGWLQ